MRALAALLIAVVALSATSCTARPPPVPLRVSTLGGQRGEVTLRATSSGGPEPQLASQSCPEPCVVQIHPDGSYSLTVSAPGYHTAQMEITHEIASSQLLAIGGQQAVLVVPLQTISPSTPFSEGQ
jgi:hypothetical protein